MTNAPVNHNPYAFFAQRTRGTARRRAAHVCRLLRALGASGGKTRFFTLAGRADDRPCVVARYIVVVLFRRLERLRAPAMRQFVAPFFLDIYVIWRIRLSRERTLYVVNKSRFPRDLLFRQSRLSRINCDLYLAEMRDLSAGDLYCGIRGVTLGENCFAIYRWCQGPCSIVFWIREKRLCWIAAKVKVRIMKYPPCTIRMIWNSSEKYNLKIVPIHVLIDQHNLLKFL